MDKNIVNNVVSGVVGTLFGAGLTFVVTNKILRKRYENWATEQVAEVRDYYKGLMAANQYTEQPEGEEIVTLTEEQVLEALGQVNESTIPGYRDYTKPETIRLNTFADRALVVDDEGIIIQPATDEADEPEEVDDYIVIEGEPHRITQSEFVNSDGYNKEQLKYYALDNILVTKTGEVVSDEGRMIGSRHLEMFGWGSADHNLVYVRSDRDETDYEIVQLEAEYVVAVLGMPSNLSDNRPRRRNKSDGDDE